MSRHADSSGQKKEPQVYLDSRLSGNKLPKPRVSFDELEVLRLRAKNDHDEAPFFRALLDAAVYAHSPLKTNGSEHLTLTMFEHPETKELLLPFFSDAHLAHESSQGFQKVLAMTGRDLFTATLGKTLVLNPNDDRVVLYPEEISCLLESGEMAEFAWERFEKPAELTFRAASNVPDGFEDLLRSLFQDSPYVQCAYLAEMRKPETEADYVLLVEVT